MAEIIAKKRFICEGWRERLSKKSSVKAAHVRGGNICPMAGTDGLWQTIVSFADL
ncbi:hypothetical protein NXZ84_03120 [Mechercharimyces sp. CAU 1602]|nr:hypothetical protein [Mechercharimyces sp. CAU 1602]